MNPFFFLPFALLMFVLFILLLVFLFAFIQIGAISVAFAKLGLSSGQVFLLLVGSLLGSAVNIPIYRRPLPIRMDDGFLEMDFHGIWRHYRKFNARPMGRITEQVIAINFGGGVIPCLLSIYFLVQIGPSLGMALAFGVVSLAVYKLARPVPGLGIGVPFLIPPLLTVLATWVLAPPGQEAQVAYVAGSLGTLFGADILHLMRDKSMDRLQAPMLSIGGAGTFDGIFLTGILAVLLA
jgi:uncharacterized membrane protein